MNKLYPPKPKEPEKMEKEKSHGHNHDHDHEREKLVKSVSVRPSTQEEDKETAVILDPSLLKPSSFALKDLEKLRQKRY